MKRLGLVLGGAILVLGCNETTAANRTTKGTVLIEWSRADAKLGAPFGSAGPKHPVADAKIVEGPKERAYTLAFKDAEGVSYAVDLTIEFAKVSYAAEGKDVVRGTSTKVRATLASNDGFDVSAKCFENLTSVLDTMGPSDDTLLFCQITGRRPNSKGVENAIESGALLSVIGSGEVTAPGNRVEIVAK